MDNKLKSCPTLKLYYEDPFEATHTYPNLATIINLIHDEVAALEQRCETLKGYVTERDRTIGGLCKTAECLGRKLTDAETIIAERDNRLYTQGAQILEQTATIATLRADLEEAMGHLNNLLDDLEPDRTVIRAHKVNAKAYLARVGGKETP